MTPPARAWVEHVAAGAIGVAGAVSLWGALAFKWHALVPAVLAVTWLLARRRGDALGLLVVLSPCGIAVGRATVDYTRGAGVLRSVGLPVPDIANVDRTTRLQRRSSGCFVFGTQGLYDAPYNATLRLLVRFVGWMPGSYAGYYPSSREVSRALEDRAEAVELGERGVRLGGLYVALDPTVAAGLSRVASRSDSRAPVGAVVEGAVLAIRVPRPLDTALVVLLDGRSGRVIAYDGNIDRNLPPQWR